MHAAWRKRAEESEAKARDLESKLAASEAEAGALRAAIEHTHAVCARLFSVDDTLQAAIVAAHKLLESSNAGRAFAERLAALERFADEVREAFTVIGSERFVDRVRASLNRLDQPQPPAEAKA
jgi:hypothetical protein